MIDFSLVDSPTVSDKDKFHPRWEPRYLVYPGLVTLPDVAVALVRADSGDRLFDYFKPGN